MNMKTTATFTSTFSPQLMAWVDRVAQKKKQTRRAILEEAVSRYQRELARESLKKGFECAIADADMLELAEWGMDDYQNLLA